MHYTASHQRTTAILGGAKGVLSPKRTNLRDNVVSKYSTVTGGERIRIKLVLAFVNRDAGVGTIHYLFIMIS